MDLRLSRMILSRVTRFCAPILKEADAYRRKFIPKALIGLVRAGTLVGADIARAIQGAQQKTESAWKSLRRQLNSTLWDKREAAMNARAARQQARWVDARTPIPVDLSEISKGYAEKMDGLGWVRDADESSRRKTEVIRRGYWLFESYAFGWDDQTPTPLVNFSYSLEDGTYRSENEALGAGFRAIHQATGGQGVVVMDRRADADYVLQTLEGLPMAFAVRLRGDRELEDPEGRPIGNVREVAQRLRLEGQTRLQRQVHGKKRRLHVDFGWVEVRVPGLKRRHWLVAAHGTFEHLDHRETEGWWYVLTTEPVRCARDAERVLQWYRLRWKAEEAMEFLKSALGLETIRMLRKRRIGRLIVLAFWVMALLVEVLADLTHRTRLKLFELGQVLRNVDAQFLLYRARRALAVFFEDLHHRERIPRLLNRVLAS